MQELPLPSCGRRLPVTPSEAPYPVQISNHDSHRPHSRAESEPNPLPLPWRPSIVQKTQLSREGLRASLGPGSTSPAGSPPHSRRPLSMLVEGGISSHTGTAPQLVSPLEHIGGKKKSGGFLRPVRPTSGGAALNKKISSSVDAHLDSSGQFQITPSFQEPRSITSGSHSRKGGHRGQVGEMCYHGNQQPILGWATNSRMGSLPRRTRDIQALMQTQLPITSPYSSVQDISTLNGLDTAAGSVTSVDIKQEMFSNDYVKKPPRGSIHTSPQGSTTVSPHGSRAVSPHGSTRVSPHGGTRVSPHGSTRVSPHGSTRVSPHGSTRVSPHESMTVSPHESMQFSSLEGSKVTTRSYMSQQHSREMVKSHENIKVDPISGGEVPKPKRRHHRSISANPATRHYTDHVGQSSEYSHDIQFDQPMIPNGLHPHMDHHPHAHTSHRSHHQERLQHTSQEKVTSDGRKSGKNRRHTHAGITHSQKPSYLTEL